MNCNFYIYMAGQAFAFFLIAPAVASLPPNSMAVTPGVPAIEAAYAPPPILTDVAVDRKGRLWHGKKTERQRECTSGGPFGIELIGRNDDPNNLYLPMRRFASEWPIGSSENNEVKVLARYQESGCSDPKAADWSLYSTVEGIAQRGGERSHIEHFGLGVHRRLSRHVQVASQFALNDEGRSLTGEIRIALSAHTAFHGVERIRIADDLNGHTHAFGFELKPAKRWSYAANIEVGEHKGKGRTKRRRGGRLSARYKRRGGHFDTGVRLDNVKDNTSEQITELGYHNDLMVRFTNGFHINAGFDAAFRFEGNDRSLREPDINCFTELTCKTLICDDLSIKMNYTYSPLLDVGTANWVGGVHTSMGSDVRFKIGCDFAFPSTIGSMALSDTIWFIGIAGTF